MSEDPQEKRETPFGPLPQEDVDAAEYARSLESLRRFAGVDITGIRNLEDLSARASLIGHDIKVVVLAKGGIQETKFKYQKSGVLEKTKAIDRTYVIRKPVGDHEIIALSGEGHANIEGYKLVGGKQLSDYLVRLPTNQDINRLSGSRISDESGLHAIDWRSSNAVNYYPSSDPEDPKVNQGFAAVLQDSVKDLLSVLPEPTKIPDSLNF